MSFEIIKFNGEGKPSSGELKIGDVLIWLHHPEIDFVEYIGPSKIGRSLKGLKQSEELLVEAWNRIVEEFPQCMNTKRHWTFSCPKDILDLMD